MTTLSMTTLKVLTLAWAFVTAHATDDIDESNEGALETSRDGVTPGEGELFYKQLSSQAEDFNTFIEQLTAQGKSMTHLDNMKSVFNGLSALRRANRKVYTQYISQRNRTGYWSKMSPTQDQDHKDNFLLQLKSVYDRRIVEDSSYTYNQAMEKILNDEKDEHLIDSVWSQYTVLRIPSPCRVEESLDKASFLLRLKSVHANNPGYTHHQAMTKILEYEKKEQKALMKAWAQYLVKRTLSGHRPTTKDKARFLLQLKSVYFSGIAKDSSYTYIKAYQQIQIIESEGSGVGRRLIRALSR
jgi:hypothetical protein